LEYKQYWQNVDWMKETYQALSTAQGTELAAVLCGPRRQDRDDYVCAAMGRAPMLCFTFHDSHRLEWWSEFTRNRHFWWWRRVHILGVSTFDELKRWVEISEHFNDILFSVDTTKAVKWGYQCKSFDLKDWSMTEDFHRRDDPSSLRGGPIDAKKVLELDDWNDEQVQCVEYNIKTLKDLCWGKF